MKYLKLIAIFAVVAGGLYLALNWKSCHRGEGGEGGYTMKEIDIDAYRKKIEDEWEKVTSWDSALYVNRKLDINQKKDMSLLSPDGYNSVNGLLIQVALNKIEESYTQALEANPFSESQLKKQFSGIAVIKSYEDNMTDKRITNVEDLDKLYYNIKNFVKYKYAIKPMFNTSKLEWKSFNALQKEVLEEAKRFRTNPLYDKMKTIPGFDDGLDETKLRNKTEEYRASFYEALSKQIIDHIQTLEPTESNIELVNKLYDEFVDQHDDKSQCAKDLNSAIRKWAERSSNHEKTNNTNKDSMRR